MNIKYYIGGFQGNTGMVSDGDVEVPLPPGNISDLWNGTAWVSVSNSLDNGA